MRVLLAFVLMINTALLFSQTRERIILWPGESGEKGEAVISDNNSRNVVRIAEVTNPLLEVFTPHPDNSNGVGIIVCPGGGYSILAIGLEGHEIAEWLASLGYTAFVLQYRVPDRKEEALMDAQRAIRHVRSMSDKWGLDKMNIGIMGFSAGGSLSARAATLYDKQTYTPVDSIDELSCRPDFAVLIYPAYLDKGESRSLTPELSVNNNTPPMFVFATADDGHGNSALVMAGALRDAKVPVELHFMPEGGHGYGLRSGNIAAETWPALLKKWLLAQSSLDNL